MSDARTNPLLEGILPALVSRALERAAAAAELVEGSLHALGPLRRTDATLMAGDRVLNEDRDILPRVSRSAGVGLCLYLGNRRIASASIADAGTPPEPGGFADAVLVDATLRRGEHYRGTIDQQGRRTLVASRPLYSGQRGTEHGALGMIEAFVDLDAFEESLISGLDTDDLADSAVAANMDGMERITQFIDDVARRLQLLALNGNIIAAQAGDHGRAFRVVCRELSNLAEQSKDAAADARKLAESLGLISTDDFDRVRGSAPDEAPTPSAPPAEAPAETP